MFIALYRFLIVLFTVIEVSKLITKQRSLITTPLHLFSGGGYRVFSAGVGSGSWELQRRRGGLLMQQRRKVLMQQRREGFGSCSSRGVGLGRDVVVD